MLEVDAVGGREDNTPDPRVGNIDGEGVELFDGDIVTSEGGKVVKFTVVHDEELVLGE